MADIDAFGKITIDESNTTPFAAWAITSGGTIDPNWIFGTKLDAETRFNLLGCPIGPVIPVTVTGKDIRPR